MAEVELRCSSHLHAVLTDDGLIEVKCRWKPCCDEPGVVVFHYFHPVTGDLVNTKQYRDPNSIIPTKTHLAKEAKV
jgi:hypothetical protein